MARMLLLDNTVLVGIEFRLGKKELGHLHADKLADLPFPMDIRNYLIEAGRVSPHLFLPKSGWVSKSIKAKRMYLKFLNCLECIMYG